MKALINSLRRAGEAYPYAANLVALSIFSMLVLRLNQNHLLHGLDGQYMRLLVREQYEWMPMGFNFGPNPLQGMGNIFFPFNMNLVPVFAIQAILFEGDVSLVITYVLFSLELAVSVYILGDVLELPREVRLVGAWLLPVLALPFIWPAVFYPVYALVPNCIDLLFAEAALFWAFARLGRGPASHDVGRALVLSLVSMWITIANPLVVMTVVPTVGIGFVVILASSNSRALIWRLGSLAALLIVAFASGFVHFLAGNTFYTSPAFFSDELFRHQQNLGHASIFFQEQSFSATGRYLVLISVFGAIVAYWRQRGLSRYLAATHVALTSIYVLGGYALLLFVPGWRGPQMVYFEMSIWPMYCLYAAYAGHVVILALLSAAKTHFGVQSSWQVFMTSGRILTAGSVTTLIIIAVAAYTRSKEEIPVPSFKETNIVATLRAAIALHPGAAFRGSVATFVGGDLSKPISWFDQAPVDEQLKMATGNDHRLVGLWHYGIPTLVEYNHYLTPPMYLILSRIFARPIDQQMRNIMAITVPKSAALQAFGVRFVISDAVLPAEFQLRETLAWRADSRLYLYELPQPNVGNYSPTSVVRVETAAEALGALMGNFDFRREVVTTEPVPSVLVAHSRSELIVEPGHYRLRAEADGTSLIVLPIQYSHCLELRSRANDKSNARLLRVNLWQAGLLFTNHIDTELWFRSGPFGHARCRLKDIEEMEALGLEAAAKRFPLSSPTNN